MFVGDDDEEVDRKLKVLGEEGIFLEHQELNLCLCLYFCFVGTGIGEEFLL